jgi:hypothetical protein
VQKKELQNRGNGNKKLRDHQKYRDTTTGVFGTIGGHFVIWWLTFHFYLGCVFDPGILANSCFLVSGGYILVSGGYILRRRKAHIALIVVPAG